MSTEVRCTVSRFGRTSETAFFDTVFTGGGGMASRRTSGGGGSGRNWMRSMGALLRRAARSCRSCEEELVLGIITGGGSVLAERGAVIL